MTIEKHLTDAEFGGPYFGNKTRVAATVWERIGNVDVMIEPFCGSASFTLRRPYQHWKAGGREKHEILNDINAFIPNYFRSVKNNPSEVAKYVDHPVTELDLVARYRYLAFKEKKKFIRLMKTDPDYFDPKRAGYFIWGLCLWIGITEFVAARGNNWSKLPELFSRKGFIAKDNPIIKDGKIWTCDIHTKKVEERISILSNRMQNVTAACGSWKRVVNADSMFSKAKGSIGVFLDPPYPETYNDKEKQTYGGMTKTGSELQTDVFDFCKEYGKRKNVRIAVCGYKNDGYNKLLKYGWTKLKWSASGGYANQGTENTENRHNERIWFSPYCLKPDEGFL